MRLADAGDELQRLGGLRRADDADERREHAHDRAARLLERLALAEQAVVARRVGQCAVSNTATCPSKRIAAPETSGFLRGDAGAVHRVPRREVVAAVEHDVGARDERRELRRARRAPATVSMRTSGLTAASRAFAASTLRVPTSAVANRICRCRLVRSTRVGIAERERADPGGGEKLRGRRAEPARADDQRVRLRELLLRVDPELGQQDVPAVAEELGVVHVTAG